MPYSVTIFYNSHCRQLGFCDGNATTNSHFGTVPDTMAMDDVACTGSECFLIDCPYSPTDNCGGSEGAGVICAP